jgi:hypothetical protein
MVHLNIKGNQQPSQTKTAAELADCVSKGIALISVPFDAVSRHRKRQLVSTGRDAKLWRKGATSVLCTERPAKTATPQNLVTNMLKEGLLSTVDSCG